MSGLPSPTCSTHCGSGICAATQRPPHARGRGRHAGRVRCLCAPLQGQPRLRCVRGPGPSVPAGCAGAWPGGQRWHACEAGPTAGRPGGTPCRCRPRCRRLRESSSPPAPSGRAAPPARSCSWCPSTAAPEGARPQRCTPPAARRCVLLRHAQAGFQLKRHEVHHQTGDCPVRLLPGGELGMRSCIAVAMMPQVKRALAKRRW